MSNKKKEFFLVRWFKRCFLHERPELSTEEEEKIQTPMRAMVSNFTHRPLAMFGLIVFLAIFVFVMVGSAHLGARSLRAGQHADQPAALKQHDAGAEGAAG